MAAARSSWWNAGLLLGLLALRASLLGRGALSFPDEGRYLPVFDGLALLLDGKMRAGLSHLAGTSWGRPGFSFVALGPALLQMELQGRFGLDRLDPRSLLAVSGFNVACSLLSAVLFYRVLRALFPEPRWMAAALTGLHALLAASNLYLRHLLPYEAALLLMMVSLERGVAFLTGPRRWGGVGSALASGAAAGLGFAIYPGFYPMPAIVGAAVLLVAFRQGRWPGATWLAGFPSGLGLALLPFVRLPGYDYRGELRWLSASVVQGDFDEGFRFVFEYLWRVEGVMGLILMAAAAIALGTVAGDGIRWLRVRSAPDGPALVAQALFTVAAAVMLFQMVNAYVLQRMVWYGRLLHVYYPFLVIGLGLALSRLPLAKLQARTVVVLGVLQVLCAVRFFHGYAALAYPRDVLYSLRITLADVPLPHRILETPTRYDVVAPPVFPGTQAAYPADALVLVNFGYLYQSGPGEYARYEPPVPYRQIYAAPHFLAFTPYLFEGFDAEWRRIMRARDSQVRVYLAPMPAR
jgi:hypothetical protein